MIFFMQCGFALVECGSVRQKNSTSILIKNMFDTCVGSIGFWLVGYAFAFGDVKNFIGGSPDYFASSGFEQMPEDHYLLWIFECAFSTTAASIVSGSLAERCQLTSYVLFSFLLTSFIYPVGAAWNWGGGWLEQRGFHDFAGVTTIHMVGGVCGFCGAAILGERLGMERYRQKQRDQTEEQKFNQIFQNSKEYKKVINHVNKDYHMAFKEWLTHQNEDFRPHNQAYIVAGTLILFISWLFFNGGSTNDMFVMRKNGPAKIIMNSVIGGCSGGVFTVFLKPHLLGTYSFVNRYDTVAMCNGVLVGLVSITGCCDIIEPWAAFVIGAIAALFYIGGCKLLEVIRVDDPVEAIQVHGFGGIWGTIAAGIFSNEAGLIYGQAGSGYFFGIQCLGCVCIMAWCGAMSSIVFYTLKRLDLFRVDTAIELIGLDIAEMGCLGEQVYEQIRRDFGNVKSPLQMSLASRKQSKQNSHSNSTANLLALTAEDKNK